MAAEIYLECNGDGENRFYHIQVDRAEGLSPGLVTKSFGSVFDGLKNAQGGEVEYFEQEQFKLQDEMSSFICSKFREGFVFKEAWSPENIPGSAYFDRWGTQDLQGILLTTHRAALAAQYLFDEGRFSRAKSAVRIERHGKAVPLADVKVTFDVGQTCPVW